jgi:hypothetical protein
MVLFKIIGKDFSSDFQLRLFFLKLPAQTKNFFKKA